MKYKYSDYEDIDPKVLYDKVVPKCIEKFAKKQNTKKPF